ncbi:MAG: putative toxin-antitoxin system toxin component, PIN family, partial [Candidatus Thorarchaeota archaeon]
MSLLNISIFEIFFILSFLIFCKYLNMVSTYFFLYCHFFKNANNLIQVNPHYRFNLISSDPDDNKIVDVAICGNADFLITSDK